MVAGGRYRTRRESADATTDLRDDPNLRDDPVRAAGPGRGVGRALIEAVYAAACAAGSPRVYWQTHETNAAAMRLYDQIAEKSGFLVYRKLV